MRFRKRSKYTIHFHKVPAAPFIDTFICSSTSKFAEDVVAIMRIRGYVIDSIEVEEF